MKPVILTFAGHYLPGERAGGPIQTIANMVERLGDEFEFRIVAFDRDLGDRHPYPNIQPGAWMRCGKAWVLYTPPKRLRLREIAQIVRTTPHHLIYLNSFFDPRFTQPVLINRRLGRLAGVPIVIAPRGEFSVGALRIKRFKKEVYLRLVALLGLYSRLVWQASTAFEARDICRRFPVAPIGNLPGRVTVAGNIVIAPDMVSLDDETNPGGTANVGRRPGMPLRACFLSRISPKKNLDGALRALSHVRVPVQFSIFGPIEDSAYWARCQTLIAGLPPHVEVAYKGLVEHREVIETLTRHHLFLFPTRGENFGHVIYEALRAGLPLLISDQTPWRQLAENGVGWELPLDDQLAFARRIEEVAAWSQSDFERVAANARALSFRIANDPANVEANRRLFLDVVADHPRCS